MVKYSLIPAAEWAQSELGFAQLGDKRRNKRLVKIAQNLATNPGGTLPQAFPEWAELKAAYRFFDQKGVEFKSVITPHVERTRRMCSDPGEYLIIEDSTLLDYSKHGAAENLGYIGSGGRGFELHTALAVRVEAWDLDQRPAGTIVGLLGQSCTTPRPAPKGESRQGRLSRPRKSQRWAQALKEAGRPPEKSQWIYIADREADFYEPMQICQQHGVEFIIRSYQDRRLAGEAGKLLETLESAVIMGETTIELRSRPGQPARTTSVQIRAIKVDLDGPWRPGGWQPPLPGITAIEVFEVGEVKGAETPLRWLLLTSLSCNSWSEAQRIVGRYTARWWIEEYHKALKTGAGVEQSQLARANRLEPLIGVLSIVAVRLLNAKMLARCRPDGMEALSVFGPEIVALLEARFGSPPNGWSNQNLTIAIARMGGFLARKHDGMPGWQTFWRGWFRLMWMYEGVTTLMQHQPKCG